MENLPVVQKGWQVDLNRIDEGYMYSGFTCNADTRGEAKSKLISDSEVQGLLISNGIYEEEVTFLTLPVIRCKEADLVNYEGKVVSRNTAARLKSYSDHEKSLDTILQDTTVTHCYIKKRGMFYCDNYNGYTEFRIKAGIYTKEDAVKHGRRTPDLKIVPIDVTEHNTYLKNFIEEIKTRLITP